MKIVVEGLEELRQAFEKWPGKYKQAERKTMDASLLTIHQEVPGYPPPPSTSTYVRTGTLGRSLGVGSDGTTLGEGSADIYEVRQGPRMSEASFGTRLYYAPYVIQDGKQAAAHEGRWWTLDNTVLNRAAPKIEKLFRAMAEGLAAWLDGRR